VHAQNGSIEGIATYMSKSTMMQKVGDAGAEVSLCDSASASFDEDLNLRSIEWRGKVSLNPVYRYPSINSQNDEMAKIMKLKRKERKPKMDSIFASFKANMDSANNQFSELAVKAKRKTIVDRDGKFKFDNVKPGTYYILINHNNAGIIYLPNEREAHKVVVRPGETVSTEFFN
jgi:hypothetical protein